MAPLTPSQIQASHDSLFDPAISRGGSGLQKLEAALLKIIAENGGTGGGSGGGATAAEINAALKATPQPVVQTSVVLTATVVPVPANTSTTLVNANSARKTLRYMNIGLNPATVTLGSGAAVVGQGMAYNGASTAGDQGGSDSFDGASCPLVRFNVISTLGTTFVVWEGV